MSFGNTTETDVLNYIFDSATPGWAANSNFWIALYTADPGEGGSANTNEVTYTSYARVSVSRTTGFSVTGNTVENTGLVQFPQSTGAGVTATHFAVVTTSSGAGQIIIRGALSSGIPTDSGIQPQFAAGALTATLD